MSYGDLWRAVEACGGSLQINSAHMFGDESQPVIGLQVLFDDKSGVLQSEMVHHDSLGDDDAILAAARRLVEGAG